MWVIPKSPKYQGFKTIVDNDTAAAVCAANILVQSKEAKIRTWREKLSGRGYARILLGRLLVPTEKLNHKSQAALWAFTSSPQNYVAAQQTNWVDLPLFKTTTQQHTHLFRQKSLVLWGEFVSRLRKDFQQRVSIQRPYIWRTPTAHDVGREHGLTTKNGKPWAGVGRAYRESGTFKTMTLHAQVEVVEQTQNCQINPRWVEHLMGLPIGWIQPSQIKCVNINSKRNNILGCNTTSLYPTSTLVRGANPPNTSQNLFGGSVI